MEKLAEISDDFQSDTVCDENMNIDIVWSTFISVLCLQLLASCASLDARHVLAPTQNMQKVWISFGYLVFRQKKKGQAVVLILGLE